MFKLDKLTDVEINNFIEILGDLGVFTDIVDIEDKEVMFVEKDHIDMCDQSSILQTLIQNTIGMIHEIILS